VGCGRGHGVKWASQKGVNSFGIDILPSQIQKCKQNYPDLQDKYLVGAADNLPFLDEFFDKIICLEASQHFANFNEFVHEVNRVLKKGGSFVVSTIFFENEEGEIVTKRSQPSSAIGTDCMIQIDEAVFSLEANGFKILRKESIGQHTFEGFCSWAKQVNCSTPHTAKWVDLFNAGYINYYVICAEKH
jgi:cyclopropane fatty-acyl-phospholipid synthase-like methyltransferase